MTGRKKKSAETLNSGALAAIKEGWTDRQLLNMDRMTANFASACLFELQSRQTRRLRRK